MGVRARAVQLEFGAGEAEPEAPAPEVFGLHARVALNRPLRCEFTYGVPVELAPGLACGMRVSVPFGRVREVGVVVEIGGPPDVDPGKVRAISRVLDSEPSIAPELLELARWIAGYYACSWGEVLAAVLPAALKRERSARKVAYLSAVRPVAAAALSELEAAAPKQFRLLRTLEGIDGRIAVREVCRRLQIGEAVARALATKGLAKLEHVERGADPFEIGAVSARRRPETLSAEQQGAVDAIGASLRAREYATFLLQGVTGSGKTEVYLRVIEEALAAGRGAIVLVPEIALTPQTVGWFRSRFGEVAVLHSGMTDVQRHEMWRRVERRVARVVVGARSAIFAPVGDLGVVVVDEEHEPSFKQGETPRYHARDVAVMRARNAGAVCVLGSATPSLESWHNAEAGRYRRLLLSGRVGAGRLPRVEVVDMRQERRDGEKVLLFSLRLKQLLAGALERGEQAILFQNRRGFAPNLWCAACGETVRCAQCDVALAFHRRIRRAVCHSCCEELTPPTACPGCTAPRLSYLGAGSERIEAALSRLMPKARVARMDSDTMLRREDYESVLDAFGRGEIDVLVGTQMIAKGLDFPRVTVVGVVSADNALYFPDFRAAERTFQLLAQVAGRAGRGDLEGRIVIQTTAPEHPAIRAAAAHDYEAFARSECRLRAELDYPPYGRVVRVLFEDRDEARVRTAADACAALLRERIAGREGATVLGPAEAPIAMLRGRVRHHLLLKGAPRAAAFADARAALVDLAGGRTRPRVTVDVDPTALL